MFEILLLLVRSRTIQQTRNAYMEYSKHNSQRESQQHKLKSNKKSVKTINDNTFWLRKAEKPA